MNYAAIGALIFGLIAAAFVSFQTWTRVSNAEEAARTELFLQLDPASSDILQPGDTLSSAQITSVALPVNAESGGIIARTAMRDVEENLTLATVRPLGETVAPGRLLTFDMFEDTSVRRLDEVVPIDRRAITVSVDQTSSLNHQVAPGNRVDVIGVFEQNTGIVAEVLLEDVGVLAVGGVFDYDDWVAEDGRSYSTITLDVSPSEGVMMAVRQIDMVGGVVILLRNQCDTASSSAGCQ